VAKRRGEPGDVDAILATVPQPYRERLWQDARHLARTAALVFPGRVSEVRAVRAALRAVLPGAATEAK
jgi:hypothetical protein